MYGFAFYGTIGGTNPRANPDFTAQTPETRTFTDADGKVWTLHQSATFADSTIRFTGEVRSEEHTSELQSLMRISYAVFCLKKTKKTIHNNRLKFTHIDYKQNKTRSNKL